MERPIPFITLDSDKLVVNPESIDFLKKIKAPIAVITVAGLYRTGKSFILNQLAGKQSGFHVGSTVEPCTQGIWMWVMKNKSTSHNFENLILLDTEGLGSYTKTATQDMKIFSLAVLLSSYFIYNSMGTIDDSALDSIALLMELSNSIRVSADKRENQDFASFAPSFMWLIRDFTLELKVDGRSITSDEYLQLALTPLPGTSKDIQSRNLIRESLKKFFPNRKCVTLLRPVVDEELLQEIESVPVSSFRPEYMDQVKNLIDMIFDHVNSKSLYGLALDGDMFAQLAISYVNAVNNKNVPVIQSSFEAVVEERMRLVLEQVLGRFNQELAEIDQRSVQDDAQLIHSLILLEKKSKDEFISQSTFGQKKVPSNIENEFNKQIGQRIEECKVKNKERSLVLCQKLINLFADKKEETFHDSILALKNAFKTYLEQAKGFHLVPILLQEIKTDIFSGIIKAHDEVMLQQKKDFEVEIKEMKNRQESEYETLKALYSSVEEERKKEESSAKELRTQNKEMTLKMSSLQRQHNESEETCVKLTNQVHDYVEENTKLKSQLDRLKESLSRIESEKQISMKQAEDLKNEKQVLSDKVTALEAKSKKKGCILM